MAAELAAIVAGSSAAPASIDLGMVEQAIEHGVAPLLYRSLKDAGAWDALEGPVRQRLGQIARESVATEEVRAGDLRQVIAALAGEGVEPLLFKGAALAATHYPEPWLRPRGDSDLLVDRKDAAAAGRVLEACGFRLVPRPRGDLVTQQARYEGRRHGVPLAYDVHWRIADPHAFADALPTSDLRRDAVDDHPSGARRIGDVHALAVACVHRAAHHYDAPTLILLYDIDRIARSFQAEQWASFVDWAARMRMRAVSRRGLALAAGAFETPVPQAVLARLAEDAGAEPTARYVARENGRALRRIDVLVSDLQALGSVRARGALIRQHLFPDRSYITAGAQAGLVTPRYVGRIVRGARSWFRPL